MDIKDLRIDTFTNSSTVMKMRVTHIPTGLSVTGEGTRQHRLRENLIRELAEKVSAHGS